MVIMVMIPVYFRFSANNIIIAHNTGKSYRQKKLKHTNGREEIKVYTQNINMQPIFTAESDNEIMSQL